jgi:hypothetical protein
MNQHLWLWLWFGIGAIAYVVKRAYYMITGPNRAANSAAQYVRVAGVPVGFRLLVDSAIYWLCFSPDILQAGLQYIGWGKTAEVVAVVTTYAPCALFFGLFVDAIMDFVIPVVIGKLPFLKDWWPQMPGPLQVQAPPDPPRQGER